MLLAAPMLSGRREWTGTNASTGEYFRKPPQEPSNLTKIADAAIQKFSMSSLPHENCMQTRRCAYRGHQCYKKNNQWAGCRASCTAGIYEHDQPPHRTPWSCELLLSDPDNGMQDMHSFPQKRIAVKFGNMRGQCLTVTDKEEGAPVKYMPCGRAAIPWITRTGHGDFDLWLKAGIANGMSIRPSHCGQSRDLESTAIVQSNCGDKFGLQWNNGMIELTKDGVGQRLCLSTATGEVGSEAVWRPCSRYSLQFEEVNTVSTIDV